MADQDLQEPQPQTDEAVEKIELEWEEIKVIFNGQTEIQKLDKYLGGLLVDVEKRKLQILSTIEQVREEMIKEATKLRQTKSIDPSDTYELKIPSNAGEKGFLIKK